MSISQLSKIFFFLLTILLYTNLEAQNGDLTGPTEDYGSQMMDGTSLPSGDVRLISDGPGTTVRTYDMKSQLLVDDTDFIDFQFDKIPITSNSNWSQFDADGSVFQAHWITKLASDFIASEFGWNFDLIRVGANYQSMFVDSWLLKSNFDDCYMAIGASPNATLPSTYAEYDIISGKLGIASMLNLSSITDPLGLNSIPRNEIHILESFSRIFGMYSKALILGTPFDYSFGPVLGGTIDFTTQPVTFWNPTLTSTNHLEYWYFLITTGDLGIIPMTEREILDYLIQTILSDQPGGSSARSFIDRFLSLVEIDFGRCSAEYRSNVNAFNRILAPEERIALECCDTGYQILTRNTTINISNGEQFQFNGNVIVPSGITLALNSTSGWFNFPPNTGVIVENGGELVINSGAQFRSCDPTQKWNGIKLEDGSRFQCASANIFNARYGVDIHNLADTDYSVGNIEFRDCSSGIKLTNIISDDYVIDGNPYRFLNCTFGVSANNSNGTITNFDISSVDSFSDNYNGISLTDSDMKVYNNFISCKQTGIITNFSNAEIGGTFNPNHIIATEGIKSFGSVVIIDNNTLEVTESGISHIINFEEGSRISDNIILLDGDNSFGTNGILAWMTDECHIVNNSVSGSGHNASIFARNSNDAVIERNTTDAPNSNNGIALEGGGGNTVNNNDIQESPNNGLGAWHSIENHFDDNEIAAQNVGMYIGDNLAEEQRITCNRFCEGTTDLRIGSNIGAQDHHENRFRITGSRAIALNVDPTDNEQYRFGYQAGVANEDFCQTMNLFAVDDIDNVFSVWPGTSNESCLNTHGSNLIGLTEEIFCEHLADNNKLNATLWYAQLKLLLGRYFATHGPSSLPSCLQDCDPTVLMRMEAELRLSGRLTEGVSNEPSDVPSEDLKSVAARQYQQLGGQGIVVYPDLLPCIDTAVVETVKTYTETYKLLLKHISTGTLDEAELIQLRMTAELCESEYGEVVSWAQGLLASYGRYDYVIQECISNYVEARSSDNSEAPMVMKIAPIPASDQLNIDIKGLNQAGLIILTDVTGRQVLAQKVESDGLISLDVSETQNGLYFVTLSDNKTVLKTETIIIQK